MATLFPTSVGIENPRLRLPAPIPQPGKDAEHETAQRTHPRRATVLPADRRHPAQPRRAFIRLDRRKQPPDRGPQPAARGAALCTWCGGDGAEGGGDMCWTRRLR
ncbi:hypothetical protein D3C72_1947680 [compost metagenome]